MTGMQITTERFVGEQSDPPYDERKAVRAFWLNHSIDLAFVLGGTWYGVTRYSGSVSVAMGIVLAGIFAWLFVEYLVHRWLLHGRKSPFRAVHARHHRYPHRTYSGPWWAHPLTAVSIWAALAAALSGPLAALIVVAMYSGYLYFRIVHQVTHFYPRLMTGWYFQRLLRFHALHHAHPGTHFGVATTLWDRVFGTFKKA